MSPMPRTKVQMQGLLGSTAMRAFGLTTGECTEVLALTEDNDYETLVRNIDYWRSNHGSLPLKATDAEFLWFNLIHLILNRVVQGSLVVADRPLWDRLKQIDESWTLRPGFGGVDQS